MPAFIAHAHNRFFGLLAVALLVVVTAQASQAPGPSNDLQEELREYYEGLLPLSATGIQTVEFIKDGTPEAVLQWLSGHYEGASLSWSRDGSESHSIARDPKGVQTKAHLFRDGATTIYDYGDMTATRVPFLDWISDVVPDAYFLAFPPVPFNHFLSSATHDAPTEYERSLGATDALIIPNPGLELEQRLRVAINRTPLQVLSVELRYTGPAGDDLIAERFRYSQWTEISGRQFPIKHYKDIFAGDAVKQTRCLSLHDIGQLSPPNDILVASGSTFSDQVAAAPPVLVGNISRSQIAHMLKDLQDWVSAKPSSTLFVPEHGELDAAITAMIQNKEDPLPIQLYGSLSGNNVCGPVCLTVAMALQLGDSAQYSNIDGFYASAAKFGSTVKDVEHHARLVGLSTLAVRSSMKELIARQVPVLMPVIAGHSGLSPNHFVLLAGHSHGAPIIINPPAPAFVATDEWLDSHWSGDGLLLSRDPIAKGSWSSPIVLLATGIVLLIALSLGVAWKSRR